MRRAPPPQHAARLRLFVALQPDTEARARLADSLGALRAHDWSVRWVPAAQLHVTVQFLGSVPAADVPAVADALGRAAAGHAPLVLEVGGLGAFPDLRRPRVLWVGVRADPRLHALQRDVARALAGIGYPHDGEAWAPHITVARARKATRLLRGVEAAAREYTFRTRSTIDGVELMNSVTGVAGARYERLATAGLEGR